MRPVYLQTPYDDDEELGFVAAAGKVVGGAVKGLAKLGKVFKKRKQAKKKKKAAKGKVLTLEAQDIVGQVPKDDDKAIAKAAKAKIKKAAAGLKPDDVRGIVREVVSSVPSPVRAIVVEALKAYRNESAANQAARDAVTAQVDAALKPDIAAMLAVLQAQRLQGQATYEHKELVSREEFRAKTRDGLSAILERLNDMDTRMTAVQARLNRAAVVSPAKVPLFGNRNFLDS